MVDKNELRASFSERLHEALNDAGVRSRGRGVDIHNHLKSIGVLKSTQAVSKWLNGDAIAEADSIVALSSWLNVRREWLEYGVRPKEIGASLPTLESQQKADDSESQKFGKVPLISWAQAGGWCATNQEARDAETWLFCPVTISEDGYALKVIGDSMTNLGPGRTYPSGSIIFVDPKATVNVGDRVIVKMPKTQEVTFKVLVEDAGKRFLKPINPQYPMIELIQGAILCGKVVGSFVPE
ncbi:S24 family peptidase [Pseudomonas alliivorans]|nr:S24 family peptidase [Pseudomonas alliivorans]MEE4703800.1 S24 family peptidase [Pseudomonas alliivorans]MEE4739774.1 S24 family peptidase [Pseudomonas alliivorans]